MAAQRNCAKRRATEIMRAIAMSSEILFGSAAVES